MIESNETRRERPVRILVIEDNADLARQIKSTLEHALYVIDVAFARRSGIQN